jgi:hypothetical protein
MKFATAALSAAALSLVLAAAGAQADTRSSNEKATMEKKNDASSPKLDEERSESSQGQPNSVGGATKRDTTKDAAKGTAKDKAKSAKKSDQTSSAAGSSAPAQDAQKELAFKKLDLDGDGSVSKAEAAGNEKLMNGFDDADRDRDGKLSRAEYDNVGKPSAAKAKAKGAKVKAQAKAKTASDPR